MEIHQISAFLDYYQRIRGRTVRLINVIPVECYEFSYMPDKFTIADQIRHIVPDTAYIPLAKDFGNELFVPKKYGIWNTNGFCYVYQNDSLQSFYPFCGYPNQDTTKPINCIVMFGLDTVSGVLHSQIYLNKMVLEKGTYYETEPQSSPSSRFLFAAATENGCSDLVTLKK